MQEEEKIKMKITFIEYENGRIYSECKGSNHGGGLSQDLLDTIKGFVVGAEFGLKELQGQKDIDNQSKR